MLLPLLQNNLLSGGGATQIQANTAGTSSAVSSVSAKGLLVAIAAGTGQAGGILTPSGVSQITGVTIGTAAASGSGYTRSRISGTTDGAAQVSGGVLASKVYGFAVAIGTSMANAALFEKSAGEHFNSKIVDALIKKSLMGQEIFKSGISGKIFKSKINVSE